MAVNFVGLLIELGLAALLLVVVIGAGVWIVSRAIRQSRSPLDPESRGVH